MIPRLSGRAWQGRAASKPSPPSDLPPMPSRHEAERIIRQFFSLIERFELVDGTHAPEVKASLRKQSLRRAGLRRKRKASTRLETAASAGKERP